MTGDADGLTVQSPRSAAPRLRQIVVGEYLCSPLASIHDYSSVPQVISGRVTRTGCAGNARQGKIGSGGGSRT